MPPKTSSVSWPSWGSKTSRTSDIYASPKQMAVPISPNVHAPSTSGVQAFGKTGDVKNNPIEIKKTTVNKNVESDASDEKEKKKAKDLLDSALPNGGKGSGDNGIDPNGTSGNGGMQSLATPTMPTVNATGKNEWDKVQAGKGSELDTAGLMLAQQYAAAKNAAENFLLSQIGQQAAMAAALLKMDNDLNDATVSFVKNIGSSIKSAAQ
jgi:hypothetical protein